MYTRLFGFEYTIFFVILQLAIHFVRHFHYCIPMNRVRRWDAVLILYILWDEPISLELRSLPLLQKGVCTVYCN